VSVTRLVCVASSGLRRIFGVCVECLVGGQNKPTLFKVTEPSSVPYRTPSACAKRAAYPDPPPAIPLPESIASQTAYAEALLPGSALSLSLSLSLSLLRPELFPDSP